MRRDGFHLSALEIHQHKKSRSLPPSEVLVLLAHRKWLGSMRYNGSQPSATHEDAGWQLLRGMVDQLYGLRIGRYTYALHCGAGKTEAVVALLAAMFDLRVFAGGKTVLVVAQQVKELCNIKGKLLAAGVPELGIGIVHSKSGVAYPSTGDSKYPIMLATHARVQHDGSLPDCCRNEFGELHDLVIWDEALISTEVVAIRAEITCTALDHFARTSKCPGVARASKQLRTALDLEDQAQKSGHAASEISPLVTEHEAEEIGRELRSVGRLDEPGLALQKRALAGIDLIRNAFSLIDPRNGDSAALMRYIIKVPDELKNMVILDASHAIDELRQADSTVQRGTTEAMLNFKDFSEVRAMHYPLPAGKSTIEKDGKAIMQAVRIAHGIVEAEPILFITFKDGLDRQLVDELNSAGLRCKLGAGADGEKERINFLTWGMHTASNKYTHCKHVVLVGLYRLSMLVLASQFAAQRRDLTSRRDRPGLLGLEQSVIAGHVMQAMNRGCMRLTDLNGKAHPMTVHIIDKDDMRPLLERSMPGLTWETTRVKEATRVEDAASQIVAYLDNVSGDKVSKRSIFAALGINLASAGKAEAMAMALTSFCAAQVLFGRRGWEVVGQSLIRK